MHAPCPAELLAKKKKRDEQWAAKAAAAGQEARKQAKAKRALIFKKAAQYAKEAAAQVLHARSDGAAGSSRPSAGSAAQAQPSVEQRSMNAVGGSRSGWHAHTDALHASALAHRSARSSA